MTCRRGVIIGWIILITGSLVVSGMDWLLPSPAVNFWVNAQSGWWSDALIVSDGSGPGNVLSQLAPDALNWAHYELPSFLADQGTRRVASAGIEYQESEELTPEDITDWELAPSLAINVYDQPIFYGDWGGSYFMDPHSPPWAYLVVEGIKERLVTADGVSQDNIGVPPFIKGQGGFSETEKSEFRAFLAASLSPDTLASLHLDVASLDIAAYIRQHNYVNGNPDALSDPVYRAFVLYQYTSNLRIWQGMLAELSLSNKIIHGNQYGVWSPWDSNPYSVLLSQLHQVIEIENVSYLSCLPPDHLQSLTAKIGLASGKQQKPVWIRGIVYDWQQGEAVLKTNHLRLIAASAYANGAAQTFEYSQGTPNGTVDLSDETADSLLQYYDWLDDTRFAFEGRRSLATVGLVYSIPTMMWRFFPATQHWNSQQVASLSGMATVLERGHIPYDVVVFGHPAVWSDKGLGDQLTQYDLLLLPDIDSLSVEQIAILEDYCDQGGRLVATGSLGMYDEYLEPRSAAETTPLREHTHVNHLTGTPARTYYQQAVLQRGYADFERLMIAYAVTAPLGEDLLVQTSAPETVSINVAATSTGLYTIHLLNQAYDFSSDTLTPSGSFNITVRLPANLQAGSVPVHYFQDTGSSQALIAQQDGNTVTVTIPDVETHGVLCLGSLADIAANTMAACGEALDENPWAARDAEIASRLQATQEQLEQDDWLGVIDTCSELEGLIAASAPRVTYDFAHHQDLALDEASARSINAEHPDWHVIEGLGSTVTEQLELAPITAAALQGTDVLIVAPHRMAFGASEVTAIEQFVRDGGGLLFIGNGGVASSYERITDPFGLRMLPYSTLIADEYLWDEVSFDAFDIVEHPITRGLTSVRLNYAAPMTVDTQWQVVASTAAAVGQEGGDLIGPFPVVAYRSLGQGRIVAVCDNAPLGDPNETSLLYNIIQWLAGKQP